MLIDKRGKLFGKISIIDILVVLAVIVCAVGVYVRFIAPPDKVRSETSAFTYKVTVYGIREMSVEALQKSIGTKFILGEKGRSDDLGILKDVSYVHSKDKLVKDDNTVVMADLQLKYDVTLTFSIDGLVTDNGYYTTDHKNFGVGSTLHLKNKYIETTGTVVEIK